MKKGSKEKPYLAGTPFTTLHLPHRQNSFASCNLFGSMTRPRTLLCLQQNIN
uniref:Uncharacterized protein n=1 Tax=Ascaris lumbricoides TaxID=6252 RepID=A0A0M3IFY9_ASCLU